ncbi:M61 family metallopeptidase [Lewinella cohaerens]|uniref:M61 family metallopeptidase n=1 Tax=Lewinella cohaerens TaxID=70995 RepID=UPI00036C38C2|nr:PDZ domain-containing protein [Lewinella cohaerens]
MKNLIICTLILLSIGLTAHAQQAIQYTLDLNNIQHHELNVEVTFPSLPPQPLVVRMPTASPGRYATHNFAKNVYAVKAHTQDGKVLAVSRTGLNEWTVAGHNGSAIFKYTLYANRADGTYAKVDNRKLHLNMPATFVYGVGLNDRPVELLIPSDQQPDWQVATQLQRVGDRRFRAPDYYYFYDSPTFVGDIRFRSWTVASGNRIDTIEMAFLTPDPDSLLDAYAEWTRKIVLEQQAVYGELPAFDFGRYTFLCAYNPYVNGDGMEHRNSTVCSASVPLEGYDDRLIGTISHEFFHCWNVERIRPASLEPFNFDEANLSGELWFAEGFTSYFDDLSLQRAGILSAEDYVSGLTGMLNYVLLRPGTRHRGPIGMSQCAPFVDAATSIDGDNFANTFISYYSYGAVLGLALDLELRRDHGTDLSRFMRLVWERYGEPEIPYHIPDLEHLLAELTNNETFAKNWFASHVYNSGLPDLKGLLEDFGVKMELNEMDSVGFYGLRLKDTDKGLRVAGTVFANSPLYAAGLEEDDYILSLNDTAISSQKEWKQAVAALKIGQPCQLRFKQNGIETTGSFTATFDPEFNVSLLPHKEIKGKVKKRQEAWLRTGIK